MRPRLATLTAMRPPGSSLRDALGEDVLEHREVLDVGGRDVALAELLLVRLAGEVGRRGDHEGDRGRPHAIHRAGVADVDLVDHARRLDGVVAAQRGGREAGVEAAGVVVLPPGHAERGRGRRSLALRASRPPRPTLSSISSHQGPYGGGVTAGAQATRPPREAASTPRAVPVASPPMTDPKIIYTLTDEAPALATCSLLPIIQAFASTAGVARRDPRHLPRRPHPRQLPRAPHRRSSGSATTSPSSAPWPSSPRPTSSSCPTSAPRSRS